MLSVFKDKFQDMNNQTGIQCTLLFREQTFLRKLQKIEGDKGKRKGHKAKGKGHKGKAERHKENTEGYNEIQKDSKEM